jgi:hypothetical protein
MTQRWFNFGGKDEYGQQRRIEHRGRHLRISRTGGASLRAQTKAAGVNVAANSQHGIRVSRTIGGNSQLALQNGRLVFRGRYGSGATKLNLSKTGATFSTRNTLGSFNWVKPNRSAAKLFGIQVRGKKAAHLQIAYMLGQGLITLMELALMLALVLVSWLYLGALWTIDILREIPFIARQALRRFIVWRQRRRLRTLSLKAELPVPENETALLASIASVLLAWGRGENAQIWVARSAASLAMPLSCRALKLETLELAAAELQAWQEILPWQPEHLALVAINQLGRASQHTLASDRLPELLLDLDDLLLRQGHKTILQENLLAAFADATDLKLVGKRTSTRETLQLK